MRRIGEERREEHIIHDKPFIRSVAEILRERVFEGMPIRELADLLIDYWNAVSKIYPRAFEEPQAYTLLATPGIFSLHMLFPSIYARCARGGFINEDGMRRTLTRLLEETPGHPQPEFPGAPHPRLLVQGARARHRHLHQPPDHQDPLHEPGAKDPA